MTKLTLAVGGMSCDGCASSLKRLFEAEPGIRLAEVSHPNASAKVEFDEKAVSEARIAEIVSKAGFEVLPAD